VTAGQGEDQEVRRLMQVVRRALWADFKQFPGEAEDMLAEGYLGMWQNLARWCPETGRTKEQWAIRAASWAAYSYLRRVRPRGQQLPLAEADTAVEWTADLLHQWDAERLWDEAWAAASRLERRCMTAVYGHGLSSLQAAARLGLPASTVRHALQRVRGCARSAGTRRKNHTNDGCCPRGHKLTEANTYRRPNGKRACRICVRRQHRESWQRAAERRREQKEAAA
jgi:RNA polymerase sigma factor (sigma-70 family)